MKNLLEFLCKQITDSDEVKIEENEAEGAFTYTIHAPKEIMGLLIGKGGKTIRAIRSLAKARAIIEQKKVFVQIAEE
jgi:uncharacterized protein